MTTSGWLNSDALEGTSLPTKGTASSLRDLGIFGSAYRTRNTSRTTSAEAQQMARTRARARNVHATTPVKPTRVIKNVPR